MAVSSRGLRTAAHREHDGRDAGALHRPPLARRFAQTASVCTTGAARGGGGEHRPVRHIRMAAEMTFLAEIAKTAETPAYRSALFACSARADGHPQSSGIKLPLCKADATSAALTP